MEMSPKVRICLGVGGFIASNILTARNAMKLEKKLQELPYDPTLKEESVMIFKAFAPSLVLSTLSTIMIFGADKSYAKANAALIGSYAALSAKCTQYKAAVEETVGEENLKAIQDKLKEPLLEAVKDKEVSPGSILICENYGKDIRFVETTMEEFLEAKYLYNRRISLLGDANLNDFYELIGFEQTLEGEGTGFNIEYLYDASGNCWLDIYLDLQIEGNQQYYILRFAQDPIAGYKIF